jgi:uncharacterized protein YegL
MTVLVTVVGPRGAADLELDHAKPVGDLLADLAAALGEPRPVELRAADGRPLAPAASLADAGVVDGHRLTLAPATESDTGPLPTGEPLLACYLALDTSDSMAGPALNAVNTELGRLFDAVRGDARLAGSCRLSIVTFDAEARVEVPLTPAADLGTSPLLAATRPATNYEAAFRLLRRQVARDLDGLRMAGRRPLRPAVFLLTDGRPTRGYWPPAHAALTDGSWADAPDVVAFGFGEAAELAVRRIGTTGSYLPASAPGTPPAAPAGMLATFMTFLLTAVGASLGESDVPRAAPRGWRSLDDVRR